MDRLDAVRVFAKVAELESFTAAAGALGVSKAQVSKQVARLEDRLGARLLNRTTRRMSLTEVGRAYLDRARAALEQLEEAERAVQSLKREPHGTLRVAAPMSFGIRHLASAIPEFLKRYPDLGIDLDFNDRQVDLIDEGYDLAIRVARLADSSLVARRLAPCRRVVAAHPDYWDRHGRPSHPNELSDHECLIYAYLANPGEWSFQGPDGPIRVRIKGRIHANNGDALVAAAAAGLGVHLVPTFHCCDELAAGKLETVLDDYLDEGAISVHAVWPHNRHLSAKVRTFVDFLAERFGPMPYWDRPAGFAKNASSA